ncbi:MAG: tetratricopeptide repeat protein [Candidatus Omnitrophica bacterium]|nr:tetratricopeptide repeat protein [Candidatus Omnitrophota bacterium]
MKRFYLLIILMISFGALAYADDQQVYYDRYFRIAEKYAGKGNFSKAFDSYKKAYEYKQDTFEINMAMGLAYNEIKDTVHAEPHLLKAAEIEPFNLSANLAGGVICRINKNYRKSVELLEQAYRISPFNFSVVYELANTYWVGPRNARKAIEYLERARSINAHVPRLYTAYGRIYAETGNYDEAKGYYLKALDLSTDQGNKKVIAQANDALKRLERKMF